MAQGIQEPEHVWLVMMKAMRALTRYAAAGIEGSGTRSHLLPRLSGDLVELEGSDGRNS